MTDMYEVSDVALQSREPTRLEFVQHALSVKATHMHPLLAHHLTFTERPAGEALVNGGRTSELLPPGLIVSAKSTKTLSFKKTLDPVTLEKALKAGLRRVGVENPDIQRTSEGVYMGLGTAIAFEKQVHAGSEQVFADEFCKVAIPDFLLTPR